VFGLSVFAFCFYSGWQKRQEQSRNTIAIRNYHLASPFLTGDHFRDFRSQIGDEQVRAEIEWAIDRNYQVSDDALDFYEEVHPQPLLPLSPTVGAIGPATKLNAIEARGSALLSTDGADPRDWTIKTLPCQYKWMGNFLHDSCLIWANQGGGKSWFARLLAWYKKQAGYRVIVLDPDSNFYEWQGVESYHDPEDIRATMAWYVQELKGRYKAFNNAPMGEEAWRKKLWKDGKAISIVCEEATTYKAVLGDEDLLREFYQLGLTKSRKQEMPLTIIAHNNTQSILGIQGLGATIDKLLQIELIATRDPVTKKGKASGKGNLRLGESNDWEEVEIPQIASKITVFKTDSAPAAETEIEASREANNEPKDRGDSASPVELLERMFRLDAAQESPEREQQVLTDIEAAIVDFLKRKGSLTARQMQQGAPSIVRGLSSQELKGVLADLLTRKLISLKGDRYSHYGSE
jgi:hypothetical protein